MKLLDISVNKLLLLAALFVIVGCSGTSPKLGVAGGKLQPCPPKPNCVSSQATDKAYFIEPLAFAYDLNKAKQRTINAIGNMQRSEIIASEESYIRAEFTSRFFGFVDDVEFYFVPSASSELIIAHVRSASRLGRSDFGVNRNRIEIIRDNIKRDN